MATEGVNGPTTSPGPSDGKDPEDSEESEYELSYSKDITAPEDAYFEAIQRRQIPTDIRELGIQLNSKRRTAAQGLIRGGSTAWIDVDDSGTYDPKCGHITPSGRPKRLRVFREIKGNDTPRAPRPYRQVGYCLSMTFKFTLKESLEYLRSISLELLQPNYSCSFASESVDTENINYSCESSRSRRKTRPRQSQNASLARSDGLTLDQLTEGHPQRRGCKGCFTVGDNQCSLIEFGDEYPCTACEDSGIDCELIIPSSKVPTTSQSSRIVKKPSLSKEVALLPKPRRTRARPSKHSITPSKQINKLSLRKQVSHSLAIPHTTIKTCFAHPIQFNYVPDPKGSHPCSWCDMPFFGLWGHGEVEVEVIPYGGSIGNEEVEGGHNISGKENTRMCITCTFARIRITTCDDHIIQKIKDLDARSFDTNQLKRSFKSLSDGDMEGGKLASKTKWCSVCIAVAEFKCYTPQPFDEWGNPVQEGNVAEGCGIFLCYTCYETVERIERSRGNARIILMDILVRLRKQELWKHNRSMSAEGGDWVRADAEFLTSKGELMVHMKHMGDKGPQLADSMDDLGDSASTKTQLEKDCPDSPVDRDDMREHNYRSHARLSPKQKLKGSRKKPRSERPLKDGKIGTIAKQKPPRPGPGNERNGRQKP